MDREGRVVYDEVSEMLSWLAQYPDTRLEISLGWYARCPNSLY